MTKTKIKNNNIKKNGKIIVQILLIMSKLFAKISDESMSFLLKKQLKIFVVYLQ